MFLDYNFLVDVVIPLGTFIIGIFLETKWHISQRIFINKTQKTTINKNKSNENNTQQQIGRDVSNSSLQQKANRIENNFHMRSMPPTIGDSSDISNKPPLLAQPENKSNQTYIIEMFKEHATKLKINAQFEQKYKSSYEWLNQGNAQVCASKYYKLFSKIILIFEERQIYYDEMPPPKLLDDLKNSFVQIKQFMTDSQRDSGILKNRIDNFEAILISISGMI